MRAADLVRLVPSAQRIARRYARDGSEAQDLSQELLLKLLQLDSDPRTPIAYMHVVTRRLAAQLRERERREAQVAVESRRIRPPGGGGGGAQLDLHQALRRLPRRDRRLLTHWAAGFTYHEIADRLDCRYSSVGKLVQRAKRRLVATMELPRERRSS